MNRELVIKALIDWNFWYKDQFTGIPREYVEQVLSLINSGNAISILGVKRAGKSTIINQVAKKLIEKGEDPFNILIVNFEDSRFEEIKSANDLFSLYNLYKEIRKSKNEGRTYLFLDEIQKVKGWEGFVRSIVDRKEANVLISGSTASINNDNVKKVLAGRHLIVDVYPLSFKEFLRFKGINVSTELDILARESEIKAMFLEYLKFGGFPLVVLNEKNKEKILLQLYDDIIHRDVIDECNVKNVNEVRDLALFYISNPGNKVRFRKLSRSLNIPLRNLQRYTECLKNAYLIFFIKALNPKLGEMLKTDRKVYCIDNGISNVVGYRLSENIGGLFENLIFIELMRRYGVNNIFYYKGKREVDFVIKRGNEVREIYQVTYYSTDMEREIEGIKEFLRIKEVKARIITYDEEGELKVNNSDVKMVKAWKWLLME
ncbi:ATP-binding protein [Sulfolobus tengchongensis]|uniref:ATP-binding protein n=1 Tax=Sulfolobus tengchongensis TaxID=207809 RepID=A0AAX4L1C9_9CREN